MTSTTRWLVISPHLDDGVFSCGQLLAQSPGSVVVTVFAGVPPRGTPAPPWDRRASFGTADEAMRSRRDEDRRALSLLDARPLWLDFLDDQYGAPAPVAAIADRLAKAIDAHPGFGVIAPAGLFHHDHIEVQHATLALLRAGSAARRAWYFFEDAPYRQIDGLMAKRVGGWHDGGWVARPAALTADDANGNAAKAAAVCSYASQIALFEPHALVDLHQPETYWRLACTTSRATSSA